MYWRLTGTVTASIAGDRVLLLDVARDRYSAVPRADEALVRDWLEGGQVPSSPCRSALSALGIGSEDAVRSMVPEPRHVAMPLFLDAEPLPVARVSARTLTGVARRVTSAWRDVRSRQLGAVLARRFSEDAEGRVDRAALRTRLASFRAVRPLVPIPRVCLHDCLALWDWFGPRRASVELVFGVSAYPFTAHCWLQADGRVIDDHPDSPSRFQPILHLP